MKIVLTRHAMARCKERLLMPDWMERIAREPEWVDADPAAGPRCACSALFRKLAGGSFGSPWLVGMASAMFSRHTSIVPPAGDVDMRVTCDPAADALYVDVTEGEVADTREVAPDVNLDLDAAGNVARIEILAAGKQSLGNGL